MTSPAPSSAALPHDPEAEVCVLGSMLLDESVAYEVLQSLAGADFYREAHRRIFAAMVALHEAARPLDAVLVREELRRRGDLEVAGGPEAIVNLLDKVPTAAHAIHYAAIVRELAARRAAIGVAAKLDAAARGTAPVAEVLADASTALGALGASSAPSDDLLSLPLAEAMLREVVGASPLVGAHVLDEGGLAILASEEGAGKTHILLGLALDLSRGAGSFVGLSLPTEPRRVVYFWGEGGLARFQDRIRTLLGTSAPPAGFRVVIPTDAAPDIATPAGLALIRRQIRDHRADLAIVDTLSEFSGHDENDPAEVKRLVRGVNGLRRATGSAIILSTHTRKSGQFSKPGSAREVRGATPLVAAADAVLMLDRDLDRLLATWGKLRNAPQHPALFLKFNAESGRFDVVGEKAPSSGPTTSSADVILEALESAEGAMRTYEALERTTHLSRRTLERRLRAMVEAGTVETSGGNGLPAAFWIPVGGAK